MSRTNGKGTHWPRAMSANAAVVAEAVDRSKRSSRSMALQAASPIRTERLAAFDPADLFGAWMTLPSAWLGAARRFGRIASPEAAREAVLSMADRQLQIWQMMVRMSPASAVLSEQAKTAEAIINAWCLLAGEQKPRAKTAKSSKAA